MAFLMQQRQQSPFGGFNQAIQPLNTSSVNTSIGTVAQSHSLSSSCLQPELTCPVTYTGTYTDGITFVAAGTTAAIITDLENFLQCELLVCLQTNIFNTRKQTCKNDRLGVDSVLSAAYDSEIFTAFGTAVVGGAAVLATPTTVGTSAAFSKTILDNDFNFESSGDILTASTVGEAKAWMCAEIAAGFNSLKPLTDFTGEANGYDIYLRVAVDDADDSSHIDDGEELHFGIVLKERA